MCTLASRILFPRERSRLCLEILAIWDTRADLSRTATWRERERERERVCVCVCVRVHV